MSTAKEHYNIAQERFEHAKEHYENGYTHTAAHLCINAAILFNNFLFQKYLNQIPSRKPHDDISSLNLLQKYLGADFKEYKVHYSFLMSHKSIADYGHYLSETIAKQIKRKTEHLKQIADLHYS